ncbi:ArpU family transcriptional regulator, partial [Lactobacillus crispatus]
MTDRAEQMALDDSLKVDARETARNVRNFLTFKFEHFQNYAGLNVSDLSVIDDSHLSSPKMDASGVSSHGG